MSARHPWRPAELELMRRAYPHHATAEIALALGRGERSVYMKAAELGLKKSAAYLQSPAACRLRRGDGVGKAHQFRPGHTPWNKGIKGSTGNHPNTAAHRFARGNKPQTWRPIGSLRITRDGYLQRKMTDTHYTPRDWVGVHRLVWEAAHGPVPAGHVVVFRSGRPIADAAAITDDKLECISRRELMRRNTLHNLPKPIALLVQLRGALQRQINRKENARGPD